MEFLRVLRQRDVFWLWIGQVVSAIGDKFFDIAVVWIATKEVGAGAGGVVVLGTVASLIFWLLGGVYADRWNRRWTMIATDLLRALVLVFLLLMMTLGDLQLWHLGVVTALLSALNALFQPALIASLPEIVPDARQLQATNALMDVTTRVAMSIAPVLAGYLLALTTAENLFLFDALTFIVSAVAIYTIGNKYRWQVDKPKGRDIRADIVEGFQLVIEHRPLAWGIFIVIFWVNIIWSLFYIIGIPLFAQEVLGGDARTFGLIVTAYGVGNVIGGFVIGNVSTNRKLLMLFGGKVVLGMGFVILASASSLPMAMLGAFCASFGGPMTDITLLVIMQKELPSGTIGKTYSLRMIVSDIGGMIGLGAAPVFYALLDIQTGMMLCAIGTVVVGVVGLFRFRREWRFPDVTTVLADP